MNNVSGTYKIENKINGMVYVGQSKDILSRFDSHKYKLQRGSHHNRHLQFVWNKYRKDSFEFSVIENCHEDLLNERETYRIRTPGSYNTGYNLAIGGCGVRGYKHTPKQQEKYSEARKWCKHWRRQKANIIEQITYLNVARAKSTILDEMCAGQSWFGYMGIRGWPDVFVI